MLKRLGGDKARTALGRLAALGRLLGRRRGWLAALVALGLVASLLEGVSVGLVVGLVYRLIGAPIQAASDGDASSALTRLLGEASTATLALAVVGLMAVRTLVGSAFNLLEGEFSASMADEVRTGVYARFMEAPYAYVAGRGVGALLNVLEWEAQTVPDTIHRMASIIMDAAAVLIYGVFIVVLSWKLAAIGVLLAVLLAPLLLLLNSGLRRKSGRLRQSYETLSEVTVSTIEALRTLRLLRAEPQSVARQRAASRAVARDAARITQQQACTSPLRKIALLLVAALLLLVLAHSGLARPTLLTIVAILYRVIPHVTAIESQALQLVRSSAALESTLGVLALDVRSADAQASWRRLDGPIGEVRFAGVGFSHAEAGEPSLIGVDLTLPPGAFVAVTGPSGGGKTTLVNLLGRLFAPSAGEILVDGRPLGAIAPSDWLRCAAFAGQDVELLSGTILDNLKLGRPELSLEEAWEALAIAQAAPFVRDLPLGLETPVGDRGTRLSGGQRQRLVVARALARRPQLLVLDEATNAVDPEMEQSVYRAIRQARPDLTLLTITHRGDTSLADLTVVIDRGRVRSVRRRSANAPAELV